MIWLRSFKVKPKVMGKSRVGKVGMRRPIQQQQQLFLRMVTIIYIYTGIRFPQYVFPLQKVLQTEAYRPPINIISYENLKHRKYLLL